jgi:serine/threonine protein kinase
MTGEQFGPYRLDELIGRGGMGEVYRAYDTVHERTVALKRLPAYLAEDRAFKAQFRRESRIVARMRDPHIIPIHDFGEIDGRLYLEMRLVDGVDLSSLLRADGPLAPARAVAIVAQVASALGAAHGEGLVHRDVKPANVLVDAPQFGEDHAYLVDFGIAQDTSATEFGPAGTMVGSTEYMSPEQFEHGQVDFRADIYSLGCLLYTALTGSRPFSGDGPAAQMYAHLHHPVPLPSASVPRIPAELDAVISSAMAKAPSDRPGSAAEFAAAARAALATEEPAARQPKPVLPFVTLPKLPGWNSEPSFLQFGRRVADEAIAMATGRSNPREGASVQPEQGPLQISLVVAEEMSKKTINAVSEAFWARLRSSVPGLRDTGPARELGSGRESGVGSEARPDETMVFTTEFTGESDRTVIEVRIPVAALERSDFDVRQLIAEAHAAAAEQTGGEHRGAHVTVRAGDAGAAATVLDVHPLPPDDDDRP